MTNAVSSPWWYRRRSLLFFVLYVLGFYGGWWLSSLSFGQYVPFFSWLSPQIHIGTHVLLWIGAALAVAGCLIRMWGSSYLTANVVWNPDARDDRLIVDGPFRFLRNPLYFGNDLQALGIGMIASLQGFAIIVIGVWLFTAFLASHEVAIMHARYGAVYDRYHAAVPAIVPRLIPARIEGGVRGQASLGTGILSEIMMMGLAIGVIGVALYGMQAMPFFGYCWFGGWLLQTILQSVVFRRRRAQ